MAVIIKNAKKVYVLVSKACSIKISSVSTTRVWKRHVRLYRRGFKGRLSSHDEERFLDDALLQALEAAGTPRRITFDDPDAVIDVETLGNWAGLSLWTRADLARYPFLKVD